MTFKPGDEIELSVSSLGYGGEGVAKLDGMVFFVPRALPGDRVRARIKKAKKRYGSAELLGVIRPSKHRRDPKCLDFGQGCGGCQWLHLDYQEQLAQKEHTLRETIKRIGKVNVPVSQIVPATHIHGGRNKYSMRVGETGILGLNREHSHEVLDLRTCLMETPENLAVFRTLKKLKLPESINQVHLRSGMDGKVSVCFFADSFDDGIKAAASTLCKQNKKVLNVGVKTKRGFRHLEGPKELSILLRGITYLLPIGAFFQTNYGQAEVLLDVVTKAAKLKPNDSLLDLYCGVGFFTLPLAKRCLRAVGVEFDRIAAKAAGRAAAQNGVANAEFRAGDVKRIVGEFSPGEFTTVLLDPPRAGCQPEVLEGLVRLAPKKIVYVSCAPDTLARDLRILSGHGYTAKSIRPLDMFPQTYHLEAVTVLKRN